MRVIDVTLNTFADVVAHYDNTAPLGGRSGLKGLNVRPLGYRRAHDERLVKISRDCYAITDWGSLHAAHRVRPSWRDWRNAYLRKLHTPDLGLLRVKASLIWTRYQGDTYLTIRNHRHSSAHQGNNMLSQVLPNGLRFEAGPKPVVIAGTQGTLHLPRRRELKFRQAEPGKWQLVSARHGPERRVVDHTTKAKLQKDIDAFSAWYRDICHVLPDDPYAFLAVWARFRHNNNSTATQVRHVRRALRDHHGPGWMDLATVLKRYSPYGAGLNAALNDLLGLNIVTTEWRGAPT